MKKRTKFFISILILFLLSPLLLLYKNSEPEISYVGYGGQRSVSGSMHCLQINRKSYMVDAGSFYDNEGDNNTLPEDIDLNNLEAVFITHAHADHTGRIPLLLEKGYSGPIYMTGITYDLMKIMLVSSLEYSNTNISEQELLKKLKKQVYIVGYEKPFYINSKLANFFNKLKIPKKYYSWFLKNKIEAEYLYTSHLPGSAMILLSVNGKDILFSGDIGSDNNPFLKNNNQFEKDVDYLFVEGTYGIKEEDDNNESERIEFQRIIGEKISEGYRVIIPAFVLDRTQQVLYEIKKGMDKNLIPKDTIVKAYSPTSLKITEKYRHYSSQEDSYNSFFNPVMFKDIFDIQNLIYNPKKDDGAYDTHVNYGEIAIMYSGMMSHVFSKDAINKYVEDPKTFIAIVGYQAEDTEGRALLDASENEMDHVLIDGEKKNINPNNIFRTYAFNSHAKLNQIMNIFKNISPKKIFIIHLNEDEANDLAEKYKQEFVNSEIIVPAYGQKYELQ